MALCLQPGDMGREDVGAARARRRLMMRVHKGLSCT